MKKEYIITLPLPPTDNHLYGQHGHIRYMTKEGKDWKELAHYEAKRQYKGELLKGDVKINKVIYYLKRPRDIQGAQKVLWDALEGVVYENDKQIADYRVVRKWDKNNPRTEISIWKK